MRDQIRFLPDAGTMQGLLFEVPAFPGDCFSLFTPEVIGDAHQATLSYQVTVQWSSPVPNRWICTGHRGGELDYLLTLTTGYDAVDVEILLTNTSPRTWAHGMAFTCFNVSGSPWVADHEGVRHWCRTGQQMRRLIELPRHFGPRPTIQFYAVEGSPPLSQVPFADGFDGSTPGLLLENWLAVRSCDGSRLAAAACHPALFLFQNSEYSCIHSCPDFGPLAPGQTGQAWARYYLTEMALDDWYLRMKSDLGL